MKKIICAVAAVTLYAAITFLLSALVIKGICWAFGLAFSWKVAYGIWLVLELVRAWLQRSGE